MAGIDPDILIGELLLMVPGASDADGRRVSAEVVRQLRALPPLPSPTAPLTMAKLNLDVRVRSGAGPSEVGEAVARALHRALATAASSPPPAPRPGSGGADESRTLLALADEPAPPAEPAAPAEPPAPENDQGQRADAPPPPRPTGPKTRRRRPRPRATGPAPGRGRRTERAVPETVDLVNLLINGKITPSDLAEMFESLPPDAALAQATALLLALDKTVMATPALPPLPTTREIDEGIFFGKSRPPVPPPFETAREAAIAVLAEARARQAREATEGRDTQARLEIDSLTPVLRQGIINGLPGHRITALAWDRIKALLLAQFGTMTKAEAFYRTKVVEPPEPILGHKITAHTSLIKALDKASAKLTQLAPGVEIHVGLGTFVVRTIAGTERLSLHSGGLAVDIDARTNPMFKDIRFEDLKTAARIITGSERSLETFVKLSKAPSDAEASGNPDGDLLKAATDLLEATKKIETVLSDDNEVVAQIARLVTEAGSESPNDTLVDGARGLVTATGGLPKAAVGTFVGDNLGGRHPPQIEDDIATLIKLRRQARRGTRFFVLNLPIQLIVALMSPDGGNLRWLGAAHDRKDFMHFEVKNGRDLLRK